MGNLTRQALDALHMQMLIREARASIALDNDERMQTFSFDDPKADD